MAKKRRFPWGVMIVALVTFGAGIIFVLLFGERFFPPEKEKIPARDINLYFSDEEGKGLKAEKRPIKKGKIEEELKEAVSALIEGSKGGLARTMPSGTRLLSVKVADGIAYVNLSREFSSNHPGGSTAELQTIYSVVNTLTLNFPGIKKVQLLIDGSVQDTLAGHIVISIPLGPEKGMNRP